MNKIKTNILRVVSDDPTDIYYRAIAELQIMLRQIRAKKGDIERCVLEIHYEGRLEVTEEVKRSYLGIVEQVEELLGGVDEVLLTVNDKTDKKAIYTVDIFFSLK